MSKFKPVSSEVDFPALEKDLVDSWYKEGIVEKYLRRNENSEKKFSFLDGPITANNPMAVHHAWGRTYKDLWQRFYNMKGFRQRFQNGFDEQGLWVEVEVEKELSLKTKKDIENLIPGNKYASLEKFVNLCKERVKKYSAIQTEQSKRLGYFMDWDNSYHTSSEINNYTIWHYLKVVFEKGWLYKGHDSVPWCPRCGTAISQHEILTEDYKEMTHDSIFFALPVNERENEYLLAWTTTPWTIPGNVAIAVSLNDDYVLLKDKNSEKKYWVMETRLFVVEEGEIVDRKKGSELVGWTYAGPFDQLNRIKKIFGGYVHRVVSGDERILPVLKEEGTGLVHIAPGAGAEDFQLGKKEKLPVVDLIDEEANYLDEMGELSGLNAKNKPEIVSSYLKEHENGKFLLALHPYTHRYPACWRCKTELVWRVVDEWYIATDEADDSGQTYREQMIDSARQAKWIPKWGLERELDWLKNMNDWLISKKRYWGLALPIWECHKCGNFEVIGSREELKEKAVEGWEKFEGNSPHRPWIDQVKIKCPKCGEVILRIPDVGNPWLDAGIVPFSTMPEGWFPADFITEAFPGQFKNWFYSLIAMSTALKRTAPFRNLLGHAMVLDEKGEEMHKTKGNAIEFNEAAEQIGVDVMRWLYVTQSPEHNLLFGFEPANEVRRRFYLILWNSYKFFIGYANLADWGFEEVSQSGENLSVLDRWILARLNQLVDSVNDRLEKYDAMTSSRAIEDFVVNDLSTWYIRRSRNRVGPSADKGDEKAFLGITHKVLVDLSKLLAPFMPFVSEEIYKNLTSGESVHLVNYPQADKSLIDEDLTRGMEVVRRLAEIGHAQRKLANIKLRQPLQQFTYYSGDKLEPELEKILAEELNVKVVEYKKFSGDEIKGEMDTKITPGLQAEGDVRELIRQVQNLRKESGLTLKDRIRIVAPNLPEDNRLRQMVLKQTNATEIIPGDKLFIEVV